MIRKARFGGFFLFDKIFTLLYNTCMVKYPTLTATTYAAKYAFLKRLYVLLQQEHNIMGEWYNPGKSLITLETYQTLRAQVQQSFPFTNEKLSKEDWQRYQDDRFNPRLKILMSEEGRLKNQIYQSTRFSPNLDDDIIIDG
jgi:hypothetical protein